MINFSVSGWIVVRSDVAASLTNFTFEDHVAIERDFHILRASA